MAELFDFYILKFTIKSSSMLVNYDPNRAISIHADEDPSAEYLRVNPPVTKVRLNKSPDVYAPESRLLKKVIMYEY